MLAVLRRRRPAAVDNLRKEPKNMTIRKRLTPEFCPREPRHGPAAQRARDGRMNLRRTLVVLALLWFTVTGLYYVGNSIYVVLRFAPHALYADQWRQYLTYLQLPFPGNVWFSDNGHRSVLPNLIAWLEIRWFDGNQWLQIAIGLLCGFAAAATAAWVCMRDRGMTAVRRAAAAFLCCLAIFWLGNVRTLFHSTELLHTKLPMLCLMLAIALCIRATRGERSLHGLIAALLLGFAATFSFGYGLSVFVGVAATLAARKADRRQLAVCMGGLLLAAGLYLGAPGGTGVTASIDFAPLDNLLVGARWLGEPFVALFSFLWDPGATGLVTNRAARYLVVAVAGFAARHGVDLHASVMPQALFGALGMLALITASLRRLLAREAAAPTEALGLGIAWFGLGAAGIVSLSRLTYFQQYPGQIYADRYLCWACLFWLGLALVGLARATRAQATVASPRPGVIVVAILAFTLALPVFAQPTQYGGNIYAALVRGDIDNMATASIVGVIDRGRNLGETIPEEFVRGIPILAAHRVAQFATPAAATIGKTLPAQSGIPVVDVTLETRPVDANLLGEPGTAVALRTAQPSPHDGFLLIDRDRRVVGYAVRDARMQPAGYSGYARGLRSPDELQAIPVSTVASGNER